MNHRHNHRVPIMHNCMRWIKTTDCTLVLEPMGHYLVQLPGLLGYEGHYAVWTGEELALFKRRFSTPVPYVAKILDPQRLDLHAFRNPTP